MIVTDGTQICSGCRQKPSVILCDGCSMPLCIDCRTFDMWGYGCGHVDTKVFCHACYGDVKINPYSATE
jgi:hypothetical protein